MTSNLWSETEITDAVFAYLEMAHFDSIGTNTKRMISTKRFQQNMDEHQKHLDDGCPTYLT